MANTTKTKTIKENQTITNKDVVVENKTEKPMIVKDIDPNQTVTVKNGFQGALVYESPRTGEMFKWESFADEQEIEIKELRNAKSAKKTFFANNWFMFDKENEWVIDYLGLSQYYKNAVSLNGFDDLLTKPASEIAKVVSKLSKGQKQSIAYRARQMVIDGTIDSRKSISALENSLGIELIEK